MTKEKFEEHLLGIVVAHIKVRREGLLYEPGDRDRGSMGVRSSGG